MSLFYVKCELYYSKTSIVTQQCKLLYQHFRSNERTTKHSKTTKIILWPSEISAELVDMLTVASNNEIFSSQAHTILERYHSAVKMWPSVVALLLVRMCTDENIYRIRPSECCTRSLTSRGV